MAIKVRYKPLNISWWNLNEDQIERQNLLSTESTFFVIDPFIIDSLSGTKSSTLSQVQIDGNLKESFSSTFSVEASHFEDSVWADNGWSVNNEEDFISELQTWLQNNFNNNTINPGLGDITLVVAKGMVGETAYSIAFAFSGDQGDDIGAGPEVRGFFLDASVNFSVVLDETTGRAYIWGNVNNQGTGAIGNNGIYVDSQIVTSPVQVVGDRSFKAVFSLYGISGFIGLEEDGTAYNWGYSLVNGSTITSPTALPGNRKFSKYAHASHGGNYTHFFLEKDTDDMYFMRPGSVTSPTIMQGSKKWYKVTNFESVYQSGYLIEKDTYEIYSIAYSGNDVSYTSITPTYWPADKKWKEYSSFARGNSTPELEVILDSKGDVYTKNSQTSGTRQFCCGRLDTAANNWTTFEPVTDIPGRVKQIQIGLVRDNNIFGPDSGGAYALTEDGDVYAWGGCITGSTGLEAILPGLSPTTANGVMPTKINPEGTVIDFIKADNTRRKFFMYSANSNKVYAYGFGNLGNLGADIFSLKSPVLMSRSFSLIKGGGGDGSSGSGYYPFQIGYPHYGIESSTGNLYVWGARDSNLGVPTITGYNKPARSTPTLLSSESFKLFSGGNNDSGDGLFYAVRHDNAVYRWGVSGTLGVGTFSTPTIMTLPETPTFVDLDGGYDFALALDENGVGWGIGANGGNLGNNATAHVSSSFVQIALPGGVSLSKISAGKGFSFGVDADSGEVYRWGAGVFQVAAVTSPVVVSDARSFSDVAAGKGGFRGFMALAIERDTGHIYYWAHNAQIGEFGVQIRSNSLNVPSLVDNARSYVKIVAGGFHWLALDSAGQVYAMGLQHLFSEVSGNMGTVTSNDVFASPVPIMVNTSFADIGAGFFSSYAMLEDGTTYTWGYNGRYGSLGIGIAGNVSHGTPIEVLGSYPT